MALIVMFLSLFSFSLVYRAVAQNNLSDVINVNIKCRCGAVGLKTVNIIWRPLPQDQDSSYRVYYSTDTEQNQFGCTVNTTHQSLFQNELQCSITSQSLFPFSFYFKMEMTNSSGVYVTGRKTCRLATCVRCTKPQNFKVIGSGRRNLTVSWEPGPYMGSQTHLLCYRILYAPAQGKANESVKKNDESESTLVHTFNDQLNPYTMYRFYIQCSLTGCLNGWGALSGPVTGMTEEQEPSDHPRISENFTVTVLHEEYRDVTFMWRLPDKATWNGIITRFVLHYWTVNSTMAENGARGVEVFSNASNTTGTVTNLLLDETYAVTVQMCTRVGCGPTSDVIYVWAEMTAEARRIQKPPKEGGVDTLVLVIIGVISGLALIIIVASIMAYLRAKKLRKHRSLAKKKPLSEVVGDLAPNLYDSPDEPSKIEDSGVYDETFTLLLSGKTDHV